MEWGKQQSEALIAIRAWLANRRGSQVFRLFGTAGTGKTTLSREVATMVGGSVQYCAYTGKASLVLRSKGCSNACTIHSLIYKPQDGVDGKPIFVLNRDSAIRAARLIIADEISMADEGLAKDLLSFGVRLLVLGDPEQLPPIKGAGYFTHCEPDIMLTEIHRQALDNPIIALSMLAREGKKIEVGIYGESKVIKRQDLQPGEVMAADQVICGLNNTRRGLNQQFRTKLGFLEDWPCIGERLVCRKNDRLRQLFNGGSWLCEESCLNDRIVDMDITSLDPGGPESEISVSVPIEFFHGTGENLPWYTKRQFDQFDFGYARTTHTAQGSQWDHVMVFDESSAFRENKSRWLYTAITRAAQKITIVV